MSDYSKLKQLAKAADRQMPSPWSVHRDGMGSEFPPHPDQNFGVEDARGYLFGLANNSVFLLREGSRRPHHTDVRIDQMGVLFVVDTAIVGKDLGLEPFPHFSRRSKADADVGKV